MSVVLHGYWRSSAAYRVRIALNWKGIAYETRPVNLRSGDQESAEYHKINPQRRVPWLTDGDVGIGQSLAVLEWLEETRPEPPLLPRDPAGRARARSAALLIACDIHPLGNLAVLRRLRAEFGADESVQNAWAAHWIAQGFAALEAMAADKGPYLLGAAVSMADVCLVPQIANARRFGVDLAHYPGLLAADAALRDLSAFDAARPEAQPDAVVA